MSLFRNPAAQPVLRSDDASAPSKQRRNLRTRANLGLLSRSGGPVRYWALGLGIAMVVAGVVGWRIFHAPADQPPVVAYSELSRAIAAGQVKDVLLDEQDN